MLDLWHRDLNIELGLLWGLDLEVLFRFWILDLHLDSKWVMDSEFKLDLEWDSGFRLWISIVQWNLDLEFYLDSNFGLTLGIGFWIERWICGSLGMQIHHPTSNQSNPSPSLDPIPQLKYVTRMSDQTCI